MVWVEIDGFDGAYLVNEFGEIKSVERVVPHGFSGSITVKEKILKQTIDASGYKTVSLWKNGKKRTFRIHDLVLTAFCGPVGGNDCCRHLDGDKMNNNLSNLRWGTYKENSEDNKKNDTVVRGSKHGSSKLTETDVLKIRKLYLKDNVSGRKLAEKFCVSPPTISEIVNFKSWSWLNATAF